MLWFTSSFGRLTIILTKEVKKKQLKKAKKICILVVQPSTLPGIILWLQICYFVTKLIIFSCPTHPCMYKTFYRTQVNLGSDLWVPMSVSESNTLWLRPVYVNHPLSSVANWALANVGSNLPRTLGSIAGDDWLQNERCHEQYVERR